MSKKKKLSFAAAVLAVIVIAALIGADALLSREQSADFIAMNTTVSLDITGIDSKAAAKKIEKRIHALDTDFLSKTSEHSQIYMLNASLGGEVTGELAGWLTQLKDIEKQSGGSFTADLGKIVSLWDIGGENERVPSPSEIKSAVSKAGKWTFSDGVLKIADGAALDLGAVGKGIACDEVKKILLSGKCRRAVVAVGGSVLLYSKSGETFKVGIRDPRGSVSDSAAVLELGSVCVSTSGSYERFFTSADGTKYHHIFNPSTGYPAQSGLLSVTVVSESGLISDALSTACFVLGYEKSLPLLSQYGAQAVFITQENEFFATEGLRGSLTVTSDEYTWGESK